MTVDPISVPSWQISRIAEILQEHQDEHFVGCWRWCKSASIRWRGRVFDFRPVRGLEVGVKKRWPREGPSVFWIGRDGRQKGSSGSNPGGG